MIGVSSCDWVRSQGPNQNSPWDEHLRRRLETMPRHLKMDRDCFTTLKNMKSLEINVLETGFGKNKQLLSNDMDN